MKNRMKSLLVASLIFGLGVATTLAGDVELKPQTVCPVMGGAINKSMFVDVNGQRIYVCCMGCLAPIKADPEKYIEVLKEKGEKPEPTPKKKNT